MVITVREQGSSASLTEDNEFKCNHDNPEITPPCCIIGRDCGCQGRYSVYCYDCNNDDMTDQDVDNILDGLDGGEDY